MCSLIVLTRQTTKTAFLWCDSYLVYLDFCQGNPKLACFEISLKINKCIETFTKLNTDRNAICQTGCFWSGSILFLLVRWSIQKTQMHTHTWKKTLPNVMRLDKSRAGLKPVFQYNIKSVLQHVMAYIASTVNMYKPLIWVLKLKSKSFFVSSQCEIPEHETTDPTVL